MEFCIYAAITDGKGADVPISVRIIDSRAYVDDDEPVEPILEAPSKVNLDDPLAVAEMVFGINMPFPRPGVYHVELMSGPTVLMSRRVIVDLIPPPEENAHE